MAINVILTGHRVGQVNASATGGALQEYHTYCVGYFLFSECYVTDTHIQIWVKTNFRKHIYETCRPMDLGSYAVR